METTKNFNDLRSDTIITYYRISSATIGYARFGLNYINKLLEMQGRRDVVLDIKKNLII